DMAPSSSHQSARNELTAGACAGAASTFLTHPLDTLRVRMQVGSFPGAVAAFRSILAAEGLSAFWRGLSVPLAASTVRSALSFGCLSAVLRALCDEPATPTLGECAVAGSVTCALGAVYLHPCDRIKILLQVRHEGRAFSGPLEVVQTVVCRSGFRGLYRGIGVCVVMDLVSGAIYFGGNRWLTVNFAEGGGGDGGDSGDGATQALKLVGAGSLSGVSSWAAIYPLDVVRTRMAAQPFGWEGAADIARQLFRTGGERAFFRGLVPCLARSCFSDGIFFPVYWSVSWQLGTRGQD
ncbi:hypothetical protein EMIHUDRAFT_70787, partial [Emiliania huxleyi CCMP1516]|uniref:Mitochondrial carrier protein n=4 Tax=Emiliania huxleyi TaxID=2903 RepID=A0A0D3KKS7_EMIH1